MSKLKLLFTCPTLGTTTVSPFYFLVKGQDYINTLGGGKEVKQMI
ncbi:hypothetical protein [Mycoplasma wenyonii]|nr:hypothetical protein [Mycoplasma wenyonii]